MFWDSYEIDHLQEAVLGIDPGNTHSGWALYLDGELVDFCKSENEDLLNALEESALPAGKRSVSGLFAPPRVAIEMVASYGMAVGATVFDTCVWIGRFQQALHWNGIDSELVFRRDVKLHHCGQARAKDSNIRQALIDRFGAGASNGGKGTKANPGFFYGMTADCWQAAALAVYIADRDNGNV